MKRSEMLKILQFYYETDEFDNEHDAKINAHRVLDLIERNGMIPPIEPGRTVYDLDLGIPEWEPEDEQN